MARSPCGAECQEMTPGATALGRPSVELVRALITTHLDLGRPALSLGDWIRTLRLEACREDLRRPELRSSTIAAVARCWGFSNPSSFGRRFRAAYALSPREWREQRDVR